MLEFDINKFILPLLIDCQLVVVVDDIDNIISLLFLFLLLLVMI